MSYLTAEETPPALEGNHRPPDCAEYYGTIRSDWRVAGPGRREREYKGSVRLGERKLWEWDGMG